MTFGKITLYAGMVVFLLQIVAGLSMMAAGVPQPPIWLWVALYGSITLSIVGGVACLIEGNK